MTSANGNIDSGKQIEIFENKLGRYLLDIFHMEIMFFKMTIDL
jgi:hypothetical protein